MGYPVEDSKPAYTYPTYEPPRVINDSNTYSMPPQPLIQEEPKKPYVSKWQKLAQMLNESEPGSNPEKTKLSDPPKLISLIDADPMTLTPAQQLQR